MTMRFPTFGHTHHSYWAHSDFKARLDASPWPIINFHGDCDWNCPYNVLRLQKAHLQKVHYQEQT